MKLRLWKRHPRTVTVPLWRNGQLTMPEPAWCNGHDDAVAEHPTDFRHVGVEVPLYVTAGGRTFEILATTLMQEPFASGDVLPAVSVDLGTEYGRFSRAELLDFADGLVQHAGYLREFAGEVEELRRALEVDR